MNLKLKLRSGKQMNTTSLSIDNNRKNFPLFISNTEPHHERQDQRAWESEKEFGRRKKMFHLHRHRFEYRDDEQDSTEWISWRVKPINSWATPFFRFICNTTVYRANELSRLVETKQLETSRQLPMTTPFNVIRGEDSFIFRAASKLRASSYLLLLRLLPVLHPQINSKCRNTNL